MFENTDGVFLNTPQGSYTQRIHSFNEANRRE